MKGPEPLIREETSLAAPESTTGRRKLGLWMCTALVVGNMIGSGVFLLPSSLPRFGGISILGWLFTTTGALLLALTFARLSRLVPKAGGPYAFARHGFGDFIGFLVAWGYWISICAGNAAIAVAMVGYLGVFVPALSASPLLAALTALAAIWILTWVNAEGVRKAGMVQVVTTILKLLPLIAIAVFGFFYFDRSHFTPFNPSGQSGFAAVSATAALTLWAFLGLESATVPAEDVEDPKRTIPRATIVGTIVAAAVYVLGTVAVMGIIPPGELASSSAPFADAAGSIWGSWAAYAVAAGAVISCFGALNGWILLQGQMPYAAARDGLFLKSFGKLGEKGTPVLALVGSSIFVTLIMALNYTKNLVELFTFIILLATLTTLVPYVFSTMAEVMIYIRERERFAGARLRGAVTVAVLAFVYSLWAIGGSGRDTVYWGFLLLMAGIPIYVWILWSRRRTVPAGGTDTGGTP
jgi:APA family basic amino acid/polyamine antiporter